MPATDTTPDAPSSCCAPTTQATCCEPNAKAGCCGGAADSGADGCGCSAGQVAAPISLDHADANTLRETVRGRYAAAAAEFAAAEPLSEPASCCGSDASILSEEQLAVFGGALYDGDAQQELPGTAVLGSLGCGNPTAVAALEPGETVLDLGSGGGIDVLLSARRVGPSGKAYGLDMTDEMLELARRNQAEAGVANAEFLRGTIEQIPLPDASVDVIISNCVINLSGDKPQVLREAARVLRPGGRFAVSDVIADETMDAATRADMEAYTGCIAGALTEREFRAQLAAAGFEQIEIQVTHRVHEHAASAVVRAVKPA